MVKIDPLNDFKKLQDSINEKIEKTLSTIKHPYSHITQNSNAVRIEVKLSEVEEKDLFLDINSKRIIIKAEIGKTEVKTAKDEYSKSAYSKQLYRKILLPPDLDIKKTKTKFSEGTLKIKIPKKK